jgi:predicted transposase YbfD/YdcC
LAATAEQVCFPAVAQAARQTRASDRHGAKSEGIETDWLISSRPVERFSPLQTAQTDHVNWGIENGFPLRLDVAAGEDRSRVRHPTSVLNLAMIRRAVLSLAVRWIQQCRHRRQATLQGCSAPTSVFPPPPTPRTHAMTRENNRGRHEIRVLDCRSASPQQVGFPGVQTIARLRRRVRRKGKKTTEIVYLISSLTLEELDALGFLKLKRGYWVIESGLHHALDVTLGEDHSRVRNSTAAFALSLFRRVVASFAQVWLQECRKLNPRSRATTGKFPKRFRHRNGGPERLHALIFAKSPASWRLPE